MPQQHKTDRAGIEQYHSDNNDFTITWTVKSENGVTQSWAYGIFPYLNSKTKSSPSYAYYFASGGKLPEVLRCPKDTCNINMSLHLGYGINQWLCGTDSNCQGGISLRKLKAPEKRVIVADNAWGAINHAGDQTFKHMAVVHSTIMEVNAPTKAHHGEVGIIKHKKAPFLFIAGNAAPLTDKQCSSREKSAGMWNLPWGMYWDSAAGKYKVWDNAKDLGDL